MRDRRRGGPISSGRPTLPTGMKPPRGRVSLDAAVPSVGMNPGTMQAEVMP